MARAQAFLPLVCPNKSPTLHHCSTTTIVLASFLLVDLGSPQFEAILFAVLACSFYLLESFVDDLEDPFGGSWTVDAALDACDELVDALAVEE